jgi:superfamily II DNA helicase RecQ
MAYRFFAVSTRPDPAAEAELNGFLASHRILSVDRRLVEATDGVFWAFCVDFLDRSAASSQRDVRNRSQVDYKEVLTPAQFAVFASLRELRKQVAQTEAVPVYTIFTNEQLARMVQTGVTTRAALGKIEGVGEARIEKYGERFLALLGSPPPGDAGHETSKQFVRQDPGA